MSKLSKKISILIAGFLLVPALLLPAFCFAEIKTYSREPSGYTTWNPINFYVEWEEPLCPPETAPWWSIVVRRGPGVFFWADECYSFEEGLSGSFEMNLPLGTYDYVRADCWRTACTPPTFYDSYYLENLGGGQKIFEVIEAPEEERFPIIDLGIDFATGTLAYVGYLFTDLKLLIVMIVGLSLAFWVIWKLIFLGKLETKEKKLPKEKEKKENKDISLGLTREGKFWARYERLEPFSKERKFEDDL